MFGVTCQVSGVTRHRGNHVLNSARNTALVTSHVSKSKMLLLRKVILQRFTLKVHCAARLKCDSVLFRIQTCSYKLPLQARVNFNFMSFSVADLALTLK
jgi:hypothetical protein